MKVTLKQFRDGKMEEAILAAEPPEEPKPAETKKNAPKGAFFMLGAKSPASAGNGAEIGQKGREMGE